MTVHTDHDSNSSSSRLHSSLRIEGNIVKSILPVDVDPRESVPGLLLRSMLRYSDKQLMIDTLASRKWTGRQLHSALTRVSSILADGECLGLKKGDVVAFSCPNSDWHAILLLSISTRGGIYTGTDDSYPYREFLNVVKSSGASFIISSPKSLSNALKIQQELPHQVRKVFLLDVDSERERILTRQIQQQLDNKQQKGDNEQQQQQTIEHENKNKEKENDSTTISASPSQNADSSVIRPILEVIHQKLSTLTSKNDDEQVVIEEIDAQSDLFFIPFSSGTTGVPKAVCKTHYSFTSVGIVCHPLIDFCSPTPTDRNNNLAHVTSCHPRFCHVGGMSMLVLSLLNGYTACILRKFKDPETFLLAVSDYKITTGFFIPSFIIRLVTIVSDPSRQQWLSSLDLTSLDDILIAGEFMPETISLKFIEYFKVSKYRQGFGSTEMGWSTVGPAAEAHGENVRSSGIPLPGVEVKIIPPDGGDDATPLGPNQIGEILAKGPTQALTYLNNETANKSGFDKDMFVKTGDGGYYDERGFLYVCDRFKEIIKFDGSQVSPSELESVLLSYPGVLEAAVIGIPHDVHGNLPKGFVVMKDFDADDEEETREGDTERHFSTTTTATGDNRNESKERKKKDLEVDLLNFVSSQVADHKQLRGGICILKSFPRTVLGKTDRKFLRNNYS